MHDSTLSVSLDLDTLPLRCSPIRIGRYQIDEGIGSGAMGVVYRAHDPELAREIAIKLIRTSDAGSSVEKRLLREAQALARLRHPNVVPIFDVGVAHGVMFFAMPLLDGGTLRA